jgi:hypothetical protein
MAAWEGMGRRVRKENRKKDKEKMRARGLRKYCIY